MCMCTPAHTHTHTHTHTEACIYAVLCILKTGMMTGFAEELQFFEAIQFSVLSVQRDQQNV
jgi:hypothetical protein